jgi:hypothetical protein
LRDAENDIQGWLKSMRPNLVLRCQEGKTNVYVVTGMAANVEYGTDGHTVRLRFDDGKPTTQYWSESTDHEALFAPNPTQLAKQLLKVKTLTFQFTPFNASPAVVRFNLEGLGPHLEKVANACGWQISESVKNLRTGRPAMGGQNPVGWPLGTLRVLSDPQGAMVRVDGYEVGVTPIDIEVGAGKSLVEIYKDRYARWWDYVQVPAEGAVTVRSHMAPPPQQSSGSVLPGLK